LAKQAQAGELAAKLDIPTFGFFVVLFVLIALVRL
jgi:hypothetical protein